MSDIGVAGFCAVCGKAVLWHMNGNIKTLDGIIDGLHLDGKLRVTKPGRYLHHSCDRPLTETQVWALSRIDDQFAILGPATGNGQRLTEIERNDLIERKLVAQVPLELLEGLSQPNGHWTPEYMSEIRKKHGADMTALLRPSSAASLECIHSYYRNALPEPKADGVSDGVLKSAMSAFDEIAGDYYIPFETFEEAMRAAITAALKEPE